MWNRRTKFVRVVGTTTLLVSFPAALRADVPSPAPDSKSAQFTGIDRNSAQPSGDPALGGATATATASRETVSDDRPRFAPDRRMEKLLERRTVLDLNLEGGVGHVFSDPGKWIGFGRARAGVLLVRAPFYESIGITYEYSGLSPATFGLQGEFAWAGGFWGQVGALLDTSHAPVRGGGMAALGFAILGFEGQLRDHEHTGSAWAFYGKLRLPLTLLSLAASAASAADRDRQLQQDLERERSRARLPSIKPPD